MAISVRTMLKLLAGLVATLPGVGGALRAQQGAPPPRERLTMSAFIARLRQDAGLRARFVANPRAVMREHGIDPTPFNVPERIDEAQLEGLLADWSRRAGPLLPPAPQPNRPLPAPVYGPPPGPPRTPQ